LQDTWLRCHWYIDVTVVTAEALYRIFLAEVISGGPPNVFLAHVVASSVADPHRKKADADPGKNLNADADADADPDADADADSCSY
jgi:hypothetical protein